MLTSFTLNSDSYPAIPTSKELDMRIYLDCAWILEKATFLKEGAVPEGDEIKKREEIIKSNLRDYLEEGKVDEFWILLRQTVLGAQSMFFSIDPKYLAGRIPMNPYVHFIEKCYNLLEEIHTADEEGYSKENNLLGSNKTMVAIAVRKTLEQEDSTYSFGE